MTPIAMTPADVGKPDMFRVDPCTWQGCPGSAHIDCPHKWPMKPPVDYKALAHQLRDAISGGPEALPADEGDISEERQHKWLTEEWAPWVDRMARALIAFRKAHEPFTNGAGVKRDE